MMKKEFGFVAGVMVIALHSATALAAVSEEEAKALGTSLTEFGAEKQASADGTIPAYNGGLTTAPADFDPKSGLIPDPFKDEKPLYSITGKNMAQYADRLSPGVQALLKRFPTYHVDVFPTHRTMHYPQWVLDNTVKNATTAKLVGKVKGDGVEGAFGGIPFPIPKDGYEVMFNSALNFQRTQYENQAKAWLVDSAGNRSELPENDANDYRPYYDRALAQGKAPHNAYDVYHVVQVSPPTGVGTAVLVYTPINNATDEQVTWLYMPGQRRTRMAPDYKYDTPISQFGGVMFWDDLGLYHGRMDRFDFKVIGKKEMIVPYSSYKYLSMSPDQLFGKQHLNPDAIRWETHRVWVVEATLKQGERHAYSKRTFYIDEDTWAIVEADAYDPEGKLWKVGFMYTFNYYDGGGGTFNAIYNIYDLQKGDYFGTNAGGPANGRPFIRPFDTHQKESLFTPAGMSGTGMH
jgi:Protein of unknown function (DUF1329)